MGGFFHFVCDSEASADPACFFELLSRLLSAFDSVFEIGESKLGRGGLAVEQALFHNVLKSFISAAGGRIIVVSYYS